MFKLFMILLFVILGFVNYVALIPDAMFFVATMILGSIVLIRQYLKRDKKDIDDSLAAMRTLIKWANDNNIGQHALPRSIEALKNITSLNLSNQGIIQLPKEIGSLSNLEELNLDYNLLVELPDEIRTLVNLHTLRLSNNKFKRRPKILATLPNITTLTLENNQIFRQTPEIEAFNYLAGDVAHRRAGVRPEDESNLLNRGKRGRGEIIENDDDMQALLDEPSYSRFSK